MTVRLRNLATLLATVGFLSSAGGSGMVQAAELSCGVPQFAGTPAPAKQSRGPEGKFRIFWQISTLIENLADASGNARSMATIKQATALSDGYSINVLLAGPLTYWLGRPNECSINFKRIANGDSIEVAGQTYAFAEGGIAGRDECDRKQKEYLDAEEGGKSEKEVQIAALKRVFANLDLAGEQQRGKPIWGATIIGNTEFSYDKVAGKVKMTEVPKTYCLLFDSGIPPNGMMIYQEHRLQVERGKFLWIPRVNSKGKLIFSKPILDIIPDNTHAFKLLADSFVDADIPAGELRGNIRRWRDPRSPRAAAELVKIKQFGGYNFEGGTRMLVDPKKTVENLVEGMSWILTNTDRDISLLMPGYWDRDQVGNEDEIDTLPGRLRQLVLKINTQLGAKMKQENPICSNRIVFIVGSYGRPVRVEPLPMYRDSGKLAGTVTGQIKMLSDVRAEVCGG